MKVWRRRGREGQVGVEKGRDGVCEVGVGVATTVNNLTTVGGERNAR